MNPGLVGLLEDVCDKIIFKLRTNESFYRMCVDKIPHASSAITFAIAICCKDCLKDKKWHKLFQAPFIMTLFVSDELYLVLLYLMLTADYILY